VIAVVIETLKSLPSWARVVIALLATLAGIALYVYRDVARPEMRLARMAEDSAETLRHLTESLPPAPITLFRDEDAHVTISAMAWRDTCVVVSADTPEGRLNMLVRLGRDRGLHTASAGLRDLLAAAVPRLPAVHAQCRTGGNCDPNGWHPGVPEREWREEGPGWFQIHSAWHGGGCYRVTTVYTATGAYQIRWVCCAH
jgi:hypothetical protein